MQFSAITGILLCLAVIAAGNVCTYFGTTVKYSLVAGSTITNVGFTNVTGNVAIGPGTSLTGFPPGHITGYKSLGDLEGVQAQVDATLAFNYFHGLKPTKVVTNMDLAGTTFKAGIYNWPSSAMISANGIVTLDGPGMYVFQMGSTLTTFANTAVKLTNNATSGCVFWIIGSSGTFGANTLFTGDILAKASVSIGANVKCLGSIFAQAAITISDPSTLIGHPCQC